MMIFGRLIYRLCMDIMKAFYGIMGCCVVALEAGGIIFGISAVIRKLRRH